MLERALRVYMGGYHPGNLKKLLHNFWGTYSITYLFVISPLVIFDEIVFSSLGNALLYYCIVIMMMVGVSNNVLVPLTLQKQMFLAPMEEKERTEYIKALLLVKLVVPFFMMAVLLLGLAIAFQKDLLMLLNVLFATISLTVTVILQPVGERERKTGQRVKNSWIAMLWYTVNILFAAFHLVIAVLSILDEEPHSLGVGIYFGISLVIQVILNIYIYRRNVPIIIEGAMDYENCMCMLENVDKSLSNKK